MRRPRQLRVQLHRVQLHRGAELTPADRAQHPQVYRLMQGLDRIP